MTTHEGRFYQAFGARMYPGCLQQPRLPFAVAARGPRGMRLAARFGSTWVTEGPLAADGGVSSVTAALPALAAELERVDAACTEVGRDLASLGRLLYVGMRIGGVTASPETFRDAVGRLAQLGLTDLVISWPRASAPFAGDAGTLEMVAAEARARGDDSERDLS